MSLIVIEHTSSFLGILDSGENLSIRRLRHPQETTFFDANFGKLQCNISARILAQFISKTGGLHDGKVTFLNISNINASNQSLVADFDHLDCVVSSALRLLAKEKRNSYLNPSNGGFDACFDFSSR